MSPTSASFAPCQVSKVVLQRQNVKQRLCWMAVCAVTGIDNDGVDMARNEMWST